MPGDVNFYLKKAPPKTKENPHPKSLIFLQFKYNGLRFVYSFDQTIDPGNWNSKKQRVKSNSQTTKDGQHSLNDLMDSLEEILLFTYRKELKNGIPSKSRLKEALDNFINQNQEQPDRPTFYKLAQSFIDGEIKNEEGEDKSPNTTKTYLTVTNHIKEFERKKKYPIDFSTINLEFYRKYINYLSEIGLAQNTRAKHIQVIKTFMNEAFDLRYTANADHNHKKFKVVWQETDAVYLNDKEILKLYNYDLSKKKKIEQARDLFVFGCYVGLRFSDYSSVQPEHIVKVPIEEGETEYFIKMRTTKTGELVVIPCNPIVLQIFKKYKNNPNKLPRSISNQKFNDYIKEACQDAKLKEKGRLSTDPKLELWQCVSSHTARRSFATNLYLEGFPVIDLMKITGHRTEKSFLKYIKVSKLDAAKRLSDHMRKQWSSKLLKVA